MSFKKGLLYLKDIGKTDTWLPVYQTFCPHQFLSIQATSIGCGGLEGGGVGGWRGGGGGRERKLATMSEQFEYLH